MASILGGAVHERLIALPVREGTVSGGNRAVATGAQGQAFPPGGSFAGLAQAQLDDAGGQHDKRQVLAWGKAGGLEPAAFEADDRMGFAARKVAAFLNFKGSGSVFYHTGAEWIFELKRKDWQGPDKGAGRMPRMAKNSRASSPSKANGDLKLAETSAPVSARQWRKNSLPRCMRVRNLLSSGAVSVLAAFLLGGCTTDRITEPARSATEQLLLSTAADHAVQSARQLEIFANRKVFLDATYFDSYDSKYALGTIRDALSRAGALLEDNPTNSDIIIEARSGVLSVDSSDVLFGLPKTTVPVPMAGPVQTPEVAFYKSHTEKSVAKIALLAFAKTSRAHVYSSGTLDGESYDKSHSLLFVSWSRTDIPEKQKTEKKSEPYHQAWLSQYDAANLAPTNGPAKQ